MKQEMEYIYEIYRQGNIMKAADKLFVSQPALSMALRKTEDELGVRLFDRGTRPMRLTEAGRIYIRAIEKMRVLEQELDARLSDLSELRSGVLRIGGSHYINSYILAPVLSRFHKLYPGIQIEITEDSSAALSELLREHRIDLTLNCNDEVIREFAHRPAFEDQILLAVPASYPINEENHDYAMTAQDIIDGRHHTDACPAVYLHDFQSLPYIILDQGNNLHERALQMFEEACFSPDITLSLAQLATAYHMAAAGYGATLTCDRLVVSADIPLCFYKLRSPAAIRQFYFILPESDYIPRAVQELIRMF